jgi:hypothetical protein
MINTYLSWARLQLMRKGAATQRFAISGKWIIEIVEFDGWLGRKRYYHFSKMETILTSDDAVTISMSDKRVCRIPAEAFEDPSLMNRFADDLLSSTKAERGLATS